MGIRRARNEKEEERQRILAEARADRQRFVDVGTGNVACAPRDQSPLPTQASPRPVAHTHTMIRIRLPDGGTTEETFCANDTLSLVFSHVNSLLGPGYGGGADYALLRPIPRRVFIRE